MSLLRIDVVVTAKAGGWMVRASTAGTPIATHEIKGDDGAHPATPNGPSPTEIDAALEAIRARRCSTDEATLLGSHLYQVLLAPIWAQLDAAIAPKVDRVELALDMVAAEKLMFFPWELMRGPDGYLVRGLDRPAGIVEVTITRRGTRDKKVGYRTLRHPLRYLFVIGSGLNDTVRAGAECLGLLRQIGDQVQERIVLRPSITALGSIVDSFRPDVVHVISHGEIDPTTGAAGLRMYDDTVKGEITVNADLLAEQLVRKKLKGEITIDVDGSTERVAPAIVLLSACASGAPLAAGACEPIASGLVRAGVPIVIAMAGEIDDLACRLFARSFGEGLAERRPPLWAATIGRRAALRSPALPQDAVDWAMIDVFIGRDVPSNLAVAPAEDNPEFQLVNGWLRRTDVDLLPLIDGKRIAPPFCGRLEIIEEFYKVMAGHRPAMCITARPPRNEPQSQLGKRRTLIELTAIATREGHVPVPLLPHKFAHKYDEGYPQDETELLQRLASAIRRTRAAYALDVRDSRVLAALAATAALATYARLEACSEALANELVDLRNDARAKHPFIAQRKGNVVVLMNDIHAYNTATPFLLHRLVTTFGLGSRAEDVIPVVMTYRFGSTHDDTFDDATKEGDKRRSCFGTTMELKPFEAGEDMLAYQRVLLQPYREVPEAARRRWFLELHRKPKLVASFQRFFHKGTQGFPGKLWSDGFQVALEAAIPDAEADRPGIVREASDEELLAVLRGLQ